MGYRRCERHGWLETAEYTLSPGGETICPVCETATTGFRGDYNKPPGPDYRPREKFLEAKYRYNVRAGLMSFATYLDYDELPTEDEMLVDEVKESFKH